MKKVYLNEYNILLDKTAYLPYSTGLLAAYAKTKAVINNNYEFMPIFYALKPPQEIAASYQDPAVAAFSVSTWNEQLSLKVAEEIKQKFPNCLIIFGGASVPFYPEEYFSKYPFIDVAVRGEGERSFASILERFIESRDFSGIAGVSFRLAGSGQCVRNNNDQLVLPDENLDIFPSPYLSGIFDQLMTLDFQWQAILETNRGCPFLCSYCFWGQGGLSRKVQFFSLERIKKEIDWCAKHEIEYIFCADGNFAMFDRDVEIARYLVKAKQKYGYPERFRVNYAKTTDAKVIKAATILHKHKLEKAITVSLQSFNKQALENVKRTNMKMNTFKALQERFKDANVATYTELILGLPGETYESWVQGLEETLKNGISNDIFVYLLQIYPNTELADPQYQNRFGLKYVRMPLNEGHGAVRNQDIPCEYENVVVGSKDMPSDDWKQAAVVSWLTQALMSLKLGYFILLYLVDKFNLRYVDFIDYLAKKQAPVSCKNLNNTIEELYSLAGSIIKGDSRTVVMPEFGSIYWEPEESFYLKAIENKENFYADLEAALSAFLHKAKIDFDSSEIKELMNYQRIRVPQIEKLISSSFNFNYNFPLYFGNFFTKDRSMVKKESVRLDYSEPRDFSCDRKAFAREIILFGRKGNRMLQSVKFKEAKYV